MLKTAIELGQERVMSKRLDDVTLVLYGLFLLAALVFVAIQPYFEAKAFNDCTGGNATYMTALFTELRVEDCDR